MKKNNQIEYIVRGFSNQTRISIIFLLDKKPELSVSEIASFLNKEEKIISHHLLKMKATGILMKRYSGKEVRQRLTEKGVIISEFLKKL